MNALIKFCRLLGLGLAGIGWNPIVDWTKWPLTFMTRG
jgi:hypothetical protein